MEAWRQRLLGGRKNLVQQKNTRTYLTPTGLLMEGDYTRNPLSDSSLQILLFDPDRMFPRLFANYMTNVNSRKRKWDALEGLHSSNHE
jgi:hypothetical protein